MSQDLILFSSKDFWTLIHQRHGEKGGVYKVVAMREGVPVPINRFLNIDKNGVLYIGKANSFIARVADLKKSISPDYVGTAHDCGIRYKNAEIPKIAEMYPYSILHIELIQDENPGFLEKKLLLAYKMEFGEAPPLNVFG